MTENSLETQSSVGCWFTSLVRRCSACARSRVGPCAFSESLQYPELCFLTGLEVRIRVLSRTDDTKLFRESRKFTKGRLKCLNLVRDINIRGTHILQQLWSSFHLHCGNRCLGAGAIIPSIFPTPNNMAPSSSMTPRSKEKHRNAF